MPKAQFPDYKIKLVNDLIPYINNSRTHSDEQITQVASSIKEFGFTNPVLIDAKGGIIAGHGRVMAAKKLGAYTIGTCQVSIRKRDIMRLLNDHKVSSPTLKKMAAVDALIQVKELELNKLKELQTAISRCT